MYLPKSQYKLKQASKGQFIYEISGKDFLGGDYLHLSDGTMFATNASHKANMKNKIIPKFGEKKDNTYILQYETNERYYNVLPKGAKISKKQDDLEPIFSTKPAPTPEDYLKGYFYRYFTKRKNSPTQYYEINKEMFKSLNKKEGKYDHNLYHPQKITWDLSDNARKNNSITIKRLKSSKGVGNYPYSQIQLLFGDMEEYKLSNEVLNQTTTPENVNVPKPKLPLQRRKKVKEAQEGAIDLIKEKTRKRNQTTPSKTPIKPNETPFMSSISPSTRGGSSGGGGGGY